MSVLFQHGCSHWTTLDDSFSTKLFGLFTRRNLLSQGSDSEHLLWFCPFKDIENAVLHYLDHFPEPIVYIIQLPDLFGRILIINFRVVPLLPNDRPDPVENLAHFEVLFEQGLFHMLWDLCQFH